MLAELLRAVGDIAGYLIIALLIFIPIYAVYKQKRGKREEMKPKPELPEKFELPEGRKLYDLIVEPTKLGMLLEMLKEENITPKTKIDKHGIHFTFETERTVNCPILLEYGLIRNYNVTPLEELPLLKPEQPIIEEQPKLPMLPEPKLPESKPKTRKPKRKGKYLITISYEETFPPDWTKEQIKSAITYKFQNLIAKQFEVEVNEA